MAGDSSPPHQQSPQPSPNNSFSSSSSPPPGKDKSSSPPPSSPPPPPSKPPPSPPPPQQSNDYDYNDNNSNNNNNKNNQNEGGEYSSPSPPPPPQQSQSQSQSPPVSNNTQSPAPPQSGQQSPAPPFSPPPPTGDQRNTPSSSTSTSGGTQQGVFVPPGSPNSPTTVSPTRSPPKQSASSLNSNARSSSSSNSSSSSSSMHKLVIVGVAVGGFMLLLMVVICILCLRRKKRKAGMMPPYGWEHGLTPQGNQYWKPSPQDHTVKIPTPPGGYGHTNYNGSSPHSGPRVSSSKNPSPSLTLGFNKSSFTYDELAAATNGFDEANMLGQGGFGYVHKGVLPNGKVIAVKCLKSGSGQGEREFQAEVEIISRVHHRHLVSLVGYCSAAGQRMLVYEVVPNNNLEYHLHVKGDPPLSMSTRLRISLGSAKGLSYLHEDCHPRIIHRDIKASNILLDDNFEAMVADFGLAKLTTDTNTHISTRVMGTFGYLAPEYAASGKLTEKSDVFSFGVMLLELITGRRPVDPKMKYMEDSLVDWARPLLVKALDTCNYDELADPRLEGNYNPHEMQRMVACAAACIRHSAKRRPKMSQIVRALEGDVSLEDLNDGKPGQVSMYGSSDGSDYDSRQYSADLKKFRRMAFETQDFEATSEYGAATSEYGLNPSSSSSDNSREVK